LRAGDLKTTSPLVDEIGVLAQRALHGAGETQPGVGGGALGSYVQAEQMVILILQPGGGETAGAGAPADAATAAATPAAPPSPTAAAGTGPQVTIRLQQRQFSPPQQTVKVGDRVTWVNNDSVPHTVTADDGSWDSGVLQPGQSFSLVTSKAGHYAYYCALHGGPGGQGMAATLTVAP
jgi:plastocyanin